MTINDIPKVARLSIPERILLVEDLWDSIASEHEGVPVPESHLMELDRRMQRHNADPGRLLSLEQLQANVKNRR